MPIRCPGCGQTFSVSAAVPRQCPGCGMAWSAVPPPPPATMPQPPAPPAPGPPPPAPPPRALRPPPVAAAPPVPRAPAPAVASAPAAAPAAPSAPAAAPRPSPATPAPTAQPLPELSAEQKRKVAEYERMIGANAQARAAYLQLAKLYLEAGRKDLAAATYRRYLEIDPANQFVRQQVEVLEGRVAARAVSGPSTAAIQAERRHAERTARKAAIAATAVVLLALLVVFRSRIFPSARAIARADYANHEPFWSPDGRRLAWFAAKGDAGSIGVHDFESGSTREFPLTGWNMGGRPSWSKDGLDLLIESFDPGGDEEMGGEVVKAMSVLDGSSKVLAHGSHAAYTPDGRGLVMLCPAVWPRSESDPGTPAHMCRLDLLSGASTRIYAGEFSSFEVQPGGDRIVFQVDRAIDYDKVARQLGGGGGNSGASFDPTQSLENVVSGSGTVGGLEAGKKQEMERLAKEAKKRGRQGDGSYWMPPADLWTIAIDGSGLEALTTEGRSVLVDWTPDGQSILFLHQPEEGQKPEVWVMDAKGANRRRVLPEDAEVVDASGIAVTPDGRSALYLGMVPDVNPGLLAAFSNSPPFDIYQVALGGDKPKRLKNMHSFKSGFALSPDGKRIAYEYVDKKSGQTEIWVMKR